LIYNTYQRWDNKYFCRRPFSKTAGCGLCTQTAASPAVFAAKLDTAAWKQKSSWYIVAKSDKAINGYYERLDQEILWDVVN